jgi:hypothetical protein
MALIVSILFLAFGAAMLFFAAWQLGSAWSSRAWPAVYGTVITSYVAPATDWEGYEIYCPTISYRFVVEGREFESQRIRFGPDLFFRSRDRAVKVVQRYRGKATVRVRHDPRDPSAAVLETGIDWKLWALAVVGATFVWFGVRALPI